MQYKVLIVDDNPYNSRLIEGILNADKNNYTCYFAIDGLEGYQKAIEVSPDLILMDYMMPKMNGIETVKKLRNHNALKDTPVIMITAHKTDEVFTESFESGAFDFVVKPIDINELKSRIYKALGVTETLKRIRNKINRYEKERKELQQKAFITQHIHNSFILFNESGEIEWVNEGFKVMHGLTLDAHKQKHGNSVYGLFKDEKLKSIVENCITKKEPANFIAPINQPITNVEWVLTFITPQQDVHNDTIKFIAVESDITELKQKEQELYNQNMQMLEITENLENANSLLERQKSEIEEQKQLIETEQEKSEKLLLNILPFEVARQLKSKGKAGTRHYPHVTVLFTDFQGFSKQTRGLEPKMLVSILDKYFAKFDEIVGNHYLEKIKTIGDSYMCVGGLPLRNKSNPVDAILASLEIHHFINTLKNSEDYADLPVWNLRVGMHTGPVVAGVVGNKKFAYDIWGDTVNIAARMEATGEIGMVNVSGVTYDYIKDYFECDYRGKIEAKNIGKIDMYFVNRIKPELSADELGIKPNSDFQMLINKL